MELSVIIPAYNEEDGIKEVIESTRRALDRSGAAYEIIVIDDCSRDHTAERVAETSAALIRHPVNRGYGAALMTGINRARYAWIATIDADGSYPAEALLSLLPGTEYYDLIVGQRTGKEYRGTLFKYPARIMFRLLAEYVSGEEIPDINSGLRLFRKADLLSMPSIHICRGFSFSTTTTLMYLAGGYTAQFVPIGYHHRKGHSKVRYLRDTLRALQILLEIATHYNPIKAILPLVAVPAAGAVLFGIIALFSFNMFWLLCCIISLYAALCLFAVGMMLLQIRMAKED